MHLRLDEIKPSLVASCDCPRDATTTTNMPIDDEKDNTRRTRTNYLHQKFQQQSVLPTQFRIRLQLKADTTMSQINALLSPNTGAAVGLGSLIMTLFQLTMGFLIPANAIPPWYIWLYWINPLRYIQQGLTVNQVGGVNELGDAALEELGWKYGDRWWYCFVAVLLFIVGTSISIIFATRISWIKR